MFSVGDGHGCEGDGEANINGIEMGLIGTFEFKVRKDLSINLPVAESETHHIFMGVDPILDNAAKIANTAHKMDKSILQRFFGIFLYVVGTIFLYRYLSI